MTYFWMTLLMCLTTGMIFPSSCMNTTCQLIPGFDAELFCNDKMVIKINCRWLPFNNASGTPCGNSALHIAWPDKKRHSVSNMRSVTPTRTRYKISSYEIHKKNKYPNRVAIIIWISCDRSMETCTKPKEFHMNPSENCDEPKIITAIHSPHALRFKLDNLGEIRYREKNTDSWQTVKATEKELTVNIAEPFKNSSFVVQQRCRIEPCALCDWGVESTVYRELTEAPVLTVTNKALPMGRQSVSIEWMVLQYEQSKDETYVLSIKRLPDSCFTSHLSYELPNTTFHINLSLAFYEVTVYAKNKAGSSLSASAVVDLPPTPEFEGKLFASVENDGILLTWSPQFECSLFIINWGTNSSKMETKSFMEKMESVTLTENFEKMKKYIITIHLYPEECTCDQPTNESTFAITHIYAEEGVPRIGPRNVTIRVTKQTADISWEEIPETECLGFLVGYKIHYTEILKNTTQYVIVNSSSATRYQLTGLTQGSKYEIKISGMTKKGEGAPSISHIFETPNYDHTEFQIVLTLSSLGTIVIVILAVCGCVYTVQKTKKRYFQEVPNPKHSDIMKINEQINAKTANV
uniref:Fibronectin type-III domain-containing protein n=1 Tax=Leptobrachium leishanense TaxID=445787 RepID=A0A8C5M3B6_9ANUR